MNKNLHEQFGYEGIMPPRCYYEPFATKEEWNECRTKSSKFTSLNGEWTIAAYESPLDVAEDFYLNTPTKIIDVPSCVQFYGLDFIQYLNTEYPIPFDPPYVPKKNPTYHYQTKFNVKMDGEKKYLNFEGVDSCFYLYVNNKYVGYSQISHKLSEFDVTDYLVDGENKLDVLVLKWCAGTYFECQDKWRFTGIFRDVYLLSRPVNHVVDYKIETKMDGTVTFELLEGCEATVTFNGKTLPVKEGEKIAFKVENPLLWSAETPVLYDMEITTDGEYILEKVGIREVEIKDGLFLVNGQPIKLRGVNRHDFNHKKGATVNIEDLMVDFTLMKNLNVNAIRTSHYPSCPQFYLLCDKFGFYILDEADHESHGCSPSRDGRPEGYLSDRPEFEYPMVERQKMLVTRDKNRPCVIIWSMGNECGWGKNFYACSKWIKDHDTTRPVHYERVCGMHWKDGEWKLNFEDFYDAPIDMVSRMYASPEFMKDFYLNDPKETRPFVQCEYCHAMGNGPGDFKDYWDVINSSDRFMGGFVWEWADHGILYNTNGFRYGGDFGENLHSWHFCIDGIVSPDRKIKTGTLEMKKAYEPLLIEKEGNQLIITSRNYFAPFVLTAEITYKNRGVVVGKESVDLAIEPKASVVLDVKEAQYIGVDLLLKADDGLLKAGYVVAHESFTEEVDVQEKTTACEVSYNENGRYLEVTTPDIFYKIDRTNGDIAQVIKNGKKMIDGNLTVCVWRSPTDNDGRLPGQNSNARWRNIRLNFAHTDAYSVTADGNTVTVKGRMGDQCKDPVLKYTLTYTFVTEGVKTAIDYEFIPNNGDYYLPRVGLTTKLDKEFKNVDYFAYGPQESYIDKRWACDLDFFSDTVSNMFVHYIKPQENGSRYGCKFMEIKSDLGAIRAQSEQGFSFNATPYEAHALNTYDHDDELPGSLNTYLYLDYFMSGIGSNSCGPILNPKYRVPNTGKGEIDILFK